MGVLPRPPRRAPHRLSWAETERQVKALFNRYGRPGEGDRVCYPVAALHNVGLWDLDADPEQVPSAHGSSVPQHWFDNRQPNGGLVKPVYDSEGRCESPECTGDIDDRTDSGAPSSKSTTSKTWPWAATMTPSR